MSLSATLLFFRVSLVPGPQTTAESYIVKRFGCLLPLLRVVEGHQFLERLPELRVENRVDDGVHEAVHVPQPSRQQEHGDPGGTVLGHLGAEGVEDVTREERNPADQEHP